MKLSTLFTKPLFAALVFLLLAVVIVSSTMQTTITNNRKRLRQEVYHKAIDKKSLIDYAIYSKINHNRALAAYIQMHPQLSEREFTEYVKLLINNDTVIASMSCAKDFIINYTYPRDETVLGLNLIEHPKRKEVLMKSVRENKVLVQGPVDLVEGGKGLITYATIKVKNPENGNSEVFGVADIVISWEKMLNEAGLNNEDALVDFAMKGTAGEMIFGDSAVFKNYPTVVDIPLPSGNRWQLAAAPKNGWGTDIMSSIVVMPYFFAVLFSILIYLTVRYSSALIKRSEAKYQYIIDNSTDMIWTLELGTSRYSYMSETCYKITGFKQEEYLSNDLSFSMPQKDIEKSMKKIYDKIDEYKKNELKTGTIEAIFEVQKYKKDGSLIWLESSVVSFANVENGEITFKEVIGISRPIDDRKKMENHILSQNEQLQELNATKDKFFSIISHDLRNPIASLLNISEVFIDDYDKMTPEKVKHGATVLHDSVEHMYKLLINLLEWSRSSSGEIAYSPSQNNIYEIAKNCIKNLEIQATAKNISLKMNDFIADDVTVFCDENMIDTVIRNLVSNAIKFSFNNSTIEIEIMEFLKDSNYIQVSVKDSGVGIATENLNKLFRIDTKISTKGTNKEGGTGLGLILCKEFIDKHNSKIWVESEAGKGTTFSFTLLKI